MYSFLGLLLLGVLGFGLSLNGQVLAEFSLSTKQQQIEWDTSNLPAGVYFCRVQTDSGEMEVKKLIIYK